MAEAIDIDWEAVKSDRFKGMDYKTLAKKYGVTESCIKMRASRHNWQRPGTTQAETLLDRVVPKGRTLDRIRNAVATRAEIALGEAIGTLVTKSVTQAQSIMDRSHEMINAASEAKELADAARAWEIGHNGARKALGLDRPDMGNSGQSWTMQPASVIEIESEVDAMPPDAPAIPPDSLANPDSIT